jgi:hypothetical protein
MPGDHPDLAFVASLLSRAIERPGLTDRQAYYATRIVDRLRADWWARRQEATGLAEIAPAGRA